jgi:hypothetical protein
MGTDVFLRTLAGTSRTTLKVFAWREDFLIARESRESTRMSFIRADSRDSRARNQAWLRLRRAESIRAIRGPNLCLARINRRFAMRMVANQ